MGRTLNVDHVDATITAWMARHGIVSAAIVTGAPVRGGALVAAPQDRG